MAVTQGHGNPNWTREEVILALELFFDCKGEIPTKSDKRVRALSEFLRAFPYHRHAARKASFRNPDGVAFKLQNLRQVATGKGLKHSSRTDRAVWDELGDNPERTKEFARLIRSSLQFEDRVDEEADDNEIFSEGRIVTEVHRKRERNPKLRLRLMKQRKQNGNLKCELCGCLPDDSEFGDAIFEAHHILPLAVATERETRLVDMALFCANCHRKTHRAIAREGRWLTINDVKQLLR